MGLEAIQIGVMDEAFQACFNNLKMLNFLKPLNDNGFFISFKHFEAVKNLPQVIPNYPQVALNAREAYHVTHGCT